MTTKPLSRAAFFETLYAGAAAGDQLVIQLVSSGGNARTPYTTDPRAPTIAEADLNDESLSCFFSAVPRRGDKSQFGQATAIWLDLDYDDSTLEELLAKIHPQPTAVVRSGHGWHVYWALATGINPEKATALGKLAAVTYTHGDRTIYDISRMMRVPGSWNPKKTPAIYCELRVLNDLYYDLDELQDNLVAATLIPHWEEGQRDAMAMSMGDLFARAAYDPGRVAKVISYVTKATGDPDLPARIAVAQRALSRKEQGKRNSAKFLWESVGSDVYSALVDAMGIERTTNGGNVIINGEHIGTLTTIERDVSQYLFSLGDWIYLDAANLYTWGGKFWELSNLQALRGYVIEAFKAGRLAKNEVEEPLNYEAKLVAETARLVEDMVIFAKAPPPPPSIVPLANGALDLYTGILYPHSKAHQNRWVLEFDYEDDAECPTWLEFLNFAAPSADVVTYLQDWFGYLLTRGNPWQKMLWLYGTTGTGKSTFIRVLRSLFGPAHISLNPHKLDEYEVARLQGTLVATCSELDLQSLRTDRLKALISGDSINARHPYGRPFDISYDGKMVWGSNGLPPPTETDGFFRRVSIIPFSNKPEVPDYFLDEKLARELPGIFNWAVEGWRRQREYIDKGAWPIPLEVQGATKQYEAESDIFGLFFTDNMVYDGEAVEAASSIYAAYKTWCQQQTYRPLSHGQKFNHELRKLGLVSTGPRWINGATLRGWAGARLKASKMLAPLLDEDEAERMVREAVPLNA